MWARKASRRGRRYTRKHGSRKLPVYLFTCALILLLAGCATLPDPESTQDFSTDRVAAITAGHSVGQSFVSRRARLNGINLWLQPAESTLLKIELFHAPEEVVPLFSGYVRAAEGKTRIVIPAQADPPEQNYYLKISTNQGEVTVLGRNEDAYPPGTAFVDDQPIGADLAFQATYEYEIGAALSDLERLLSIWDVLLILGMLLFLPGWLLLDFSGLKREFDAGERLGLALGLSLAIIPLLMLWTSLVGLRWGRVSLWLVLGLLIVLQIWRWFKKSQVASHKSQAPSDKLQAASMQPDSLGPENTPPTPRSPRAAFLILLVIFALALFLRFAMVRDLAAPAWVDSIHHGLITRLILESGGRPQTYAPYLPTGADHYHFGYHSTLAAFIWLSGLEIPAAMLIFGQVLNALMVFPIYLLSKTLVKNRAASLAAALIVSTFTLMPAYYASWGRYTQLAGLLVLPAAFALITRVAKTSTVTQTPKRLWLLAAITAAGLFLIHYRVAAFVAALMLAYLLIEIHPREWLKTGGRLIGLAVFSALLLLPWLPATISDLLLPKGLAWSSGQPQLSTIPWNFLRPGLGEAALILFGIGGLLGFLRLRNFTFTVLLWTGFLYLLANLGYFVHIPGAGFINPVSMEITLFMPIAILGGFAVGGTLELLDQVISGNWQIIPRVILLSLGAWAGFLGAQRLLPTLNSSTFLARSADFPAIQWIDENLPEGESILINPTAWGYGLYMGNDGGFWISALSAHPTMPPPVIYGLGERGEVKHINQIAEAARANGEDPAALWDLMQAENIRFVYTGRRGGEISPLALSQSNLFAARYHQNGTWVFETLEK